MACWPLNLEPMNTQIRRETPLELASYEKVPSAFEVSEVFDVDAPQRGLDGLRLVLRRLSATYVKDYDLRAEERPSGWSARFPLESWGILSAWRGSDRVGGAAVAWQTPGIEPRAEMAVLWDLRVVATARRQGIGGALFHAAEQWAKERGARWLKVETQNVNVPACRFYAGRGCTLGGIQRFAYASAPDEVQLFWYRAL